MQVDVQTTKQGGATKFRKGRSGNPHGRPDSRRYRAAFTALESELGGNLSASQRMLVDEIAKLKASTGMRGDVRTTNAIGKAMRLLGMVAKPPPPSATTFHDTGDVAGGGQR
jgi:hypothetical protein